MKKDVDAGYYNFLNAAEYLEKLNKILTKVNQLIENQGYCTKCGEPLLGNEPSLCGRCI
jgi:hypothetical protein